MDKHYHHEQDFRRFCDEVYSQEPRYFSSGYIQWKGTDVCMDVRCACGYDSHIDDEFCYYVQCPSCGAKYAVGCIVKLIPLTAVQAEYAATRHDFRIDASPLDR